LYITNIVVFLTAFSIRVSLLISKIHNVDDTAKEQRFPNPFLHRNPLVLKTNK